MYPNTYPFPPSPTNTNKPPPPPANAELSLNAPKRPSTTLLPFLHDTNVPFNGSSQGRIACGQGKEEHMKAYLDKWGKEWNEMKKE
jgi:hypothetical protein